MKFLYKFHVRNEQEIRNDSPARVSYVAADNMSDAVRGYIDLMSLVQSVEFVSPITVVPTMKLPSDVLPESSFLDDSEGSIFYYHIVYRDPSDNIFAAVVRSDSSSSANSALERLVASLPFTPVIDKVTYVDDVIL